MLLIDGLPSLLLASLVLTQQSPQAPPDHAQAVRRIAATSRLAAQEYRLGVQDGKIVLPAEVEEARLFLTEARKTAALLPPDLSRSTSQALDGILGLVAALAPGDSVAARVNALSNGLAQKLGVSLDEFPSRAPPLARGAEVYQANCASCHGTLGRGDGPAALGLDPPPANLADPASLRDVSPLDYFQKITIGVTGTAMPSYESRLSFEDRWAAAAYATVLRLPAGSGEVPPALSAFATTARMSDEAIAHAVAPGLDPVSPAALGRVAAIRNFQLVEVAGDAAGPVFAQVRSQIDSAVTLARAGQGDAASTMAFDAYMTFEQVEAQVRAQDNGLATDLEATFAALRTRAAGGATGEEIQSIRTGLLRDLESAERRLGDTLSPANLFVSSFGIILREGLEAILILGALVTMLVKLGASHRKRDVHIGAGAAVIASLLTAVLLTTLIRLSPENQEVLEGSTMLVAVVMLFYVSYWLLSKMEVGKWNRFVKGKVQDALTSGSALALASVAFLAVYREGFETVLFYKALLLAGGSTGNALPPVLGGIVAGSLILVAVYYAINRFGVKIPLRPFFAITSVFLYYMAFVFAGKGVAELQEGGLVSQTPLSWFPRIPEMGIYQTVETLVAQGILVLLFVFALVWTFVIEPRRMRVTSELVPEPVARGDRESSRDPFPVDRDVIRSLERMDADLAELRAEVERLKTKLLSQRRGSSTKR
jgi:high-affinity iron transporter